MPAELTAYLVKHPETRFVDAVLYHLPGTAIGKRVPVRDAAKLWPGGVAFCAGITTLDALGTCWDVNGIGFSDGDPDATSYPLPGTLVPVPWASVPTAQVQIAPAPPQDAPHWWFDPRALLAQIVERFGELGLKPVVANELEFYFVDPKRDAKGRIRPARPARSGRAPEAPRVLAFDKLDEWAPLLAEIDAACRAQGVPAGAATEEHGGAQFEVNLGHLDDPVLAFYHALLLRASSRAWRRGMGWRRRSCPNPLPISPARACMSMPALWMRRGAMSLTRPRPKVIGGWAMPSQGCRPRPLTRWRFFAPNINSCRRFSANQFVPVNTSWGVNNRSVSFRVPMGGGSARRIEHRIAGADANPYLVMAAMLAGFHYGLVNQLTPTPQSTGNAGEEADPEMPLRLWTALDRLKGPALMAEYFCPRYPAAYAAIKRSEFEAFMADVLPREYDWYLGPANPEGPGG